LDPDGDDDPTVSGQLSLEFEEIPGSPSVRETSLVELLSEDGRDVSVSGNDGESIGFGSLGLTYTPSYEDESKQIGEIECNPNVPRSCGLSVNGDDGIDFSFPSPGTNTFKATAVAGDGVENSVTQEVDVGVGQPPDEGSLGDAFGLSGDEDFDGTWTPKLKERWEDSGLADKEAERLAFVQDGFGNVIIDTGKSYLYGDAFIQRPYSGGADKKVEVSYRIRVQDSKDGENAAQNTNRFGVITLDGSGNFRNSTIDPARIAGVDQTGKTYTLTHDLSEDTDNVRAGVFFNGEDASQDGTGTSSNGMRVIIEKIDIIDEQRDVSFEKRSPNFEENPLVRGQSSGFGFKVTDDFKQLDFAKINVSSELNRAGASEPKEIRSRTCEAASPDKCFSIGPDFTPQKLGEYIFTVGIETKTGKYFSKEYNAVSHAGDKLELAGKNLEPDSDSNKVRFVVRDNFDDPDLTGKIYKALRRSNSQDNNNQYSNDCGGGEDSRRCFVPAYKQRDVLSGDFTFRLLTEENKYVINETTAEVFTSTDGFSEQ